jgi:RNA methyltransferase, TrmH family
MLLSAENEKIKELIKLKTKKHRLDTGCYLVEGPHLFELAKSKGQIVRVFATSTEYDGDYEFHLVGESLFRKISDVETPQGVIAVCRIPVAKPFGDRVLLLDRIQDPGNMGTLLRTALAFGFTGVLTESCVDCFSSKVVRATQGAIFDLDLVDGSILEFIAAHKEYTVVGTALEDATPLAKAKRPAIPFALVLGNEGAGIAPDILKQTHYNVAIEMDRIESLNVAIAGGILMYHMKEKKG